MFKRPSPEFKSRAASLVTSLSQSHEVDVTEAGQYTKHLTHADEIGRYIVLSSPSSSANSTAIVWLHSELATHLLEGAETKSEKTVFDSGKLVTTVTIPEHCFQIGD
jgi:hypothetical protein